MPIKNLINTDEMSLREGLPEIGRCYKGGEKTDPKRPGPDLDYFRVKFNPQFDEPEYRAVFERLYGTNPDSFPNARFAAHSAESALDWWNEEWKAGNTLVRRCDGENQVIWHDDKTGYYARGERPCAQKPDNTQTCGCTHVGRVSLILTDFTAETGLFGYFLFITHSFHDLKTIVSGLKTVEAQAAITGRSLMSVPINFGRVEREISVPLQDKVGPGQYERNGKRIVKPKSLFYIFTMPAFVKVNLLEAINDVPALPSGMGQANSRIANEKVRAMLGAGGGMERRLLTPEAPRVIAAPAQILDADMIAAIAPPDEWVDADMVEEPAGGSFDEGTAGTVEPPEVTETPPPAEPTPKVIRSFVASQARYIVKGMNSALAFVDPNDQPGTLYLKDFEKFLNPLGPEFEQFHLNLRPTAHEQLQTLPESLTVTVESATKSGKAYWQVTSLKRVEQDTGQEAIAS